MTRQGSVANDFLDALPRALLSNRAGGPLREMLAFWPECLLTRVFFECRLGSGAPQVDMGVGLFDSTRRALDAEQRARFVDSFGNGRAASYIRAWLEASAVGSTWRHWVCFSETTLPGEQAPSPQWTPKIYADLTLGFGRRAPATRPDVTRKRVFEWIHAVTGRRLNSPAMLQITKCYAVLPEDACIHAVGVVLAEEPTAIRLCVAGLETKQVAHYLASLGAPIGFESLEKNVATLSAPTGFCGGPALVHLDVADRIGGHLGLEYRLDDLQQERSGIVEKRFLDNLVAAGLCTPAKRQALLRWPGVLRSRSDETAWVGQKIVISIKISADSRTGPAAKAYLMYRKWRSAS